MFKYPELFGSVAPGGAGFTTEKIIQENNGSESEFVKCSSSYSVWNLAKKHADRKSAPALRPLIWVGSKEVNYQANLDFMNYLDQLGLPYQKLVAPGIAHNAVKYMILEGM
jgi:hypothetical protein